MRVLILTNLYPTDDRPTRGIFVREQVESLREQCPDLTLDVRVIEGDRPRAEYLREMVRLPAFVKKGRYDLVHAHFGLTLISLLFVRVPIVVTFHGSDLLLSPTKYLSKILAPRASKVVVVSRQLKEYLGYGEVIPCGIPVKHFTLPPCYGDGLTSKFPRRIKLLFPSDPKRKEKDYGLFQAVRQELVRRGNEVEEILLMNINRAKIPEVYWKSDLMLLTSLSEGSPTVIKEAIAANLPFVSIDVGDVREWAKLVKFGLVVPDRNPRSIADAVLSLLPRINSRHSLDNSKCLELMNITKTTRRIRRLYNEVLEERLRPRSVDS